MTLVIGIRSLINPESLPELEHQAAEARAQFPDADILLAACGDTPPQRLAPLFNRIIHYSDKAEGHGRSWGVILDYAKEKGCDDIIVTDGKDQHIFQKIREAFEAAPPGITVPERVVRTVFTKDTIDGPTLEDLENAFLRQKWKIGVRDLQSGLFIIKGKGYYEKLRMEQADSWVGDLAFFDLLLSIHPDLAISTPKIEVRSQHYSLSSRLFVFRTIESCEAHFAITFRDVAKKVAQAPFYYLFDGRLSKVEEIENAYMNYLNAKKIHGMKGLILAAGRGNNLRPITDTRPKPIVPIANKPMILYLIEDLINAGIQDIGIVIGPSGQQIKDVIGDGSRWKVKVTYITQPAPLGLADAVGCARVFLSDSPFVVYLGDNMISGGVSDFISGFVSSSDDARLLVCAVEDPTRFGIVELDAGNRAIRITEKPRDPKSNLAVIGIYAFRQAILDAIGKIKPSARGELEITDAIQVLIDSDRPVTVEFVKEWWHDAGRPQSLLSANALVLDRLKSGFNEGSVSPSSRILGRVRIGKGSRIMENTEIRGPVVIGDGCTIGPDSFIGPYTSIGDGSEIAGTRLEFSMVFDNAKISGAGSLSDSIIGSGCRIGGKGKIAKTGEGLILGDGRELDV